MFPLTLSQGVVQKKGKTVLGPVDLSLDAAGFTVVLGPNGAGKTSLLRVLHGLERLSSGELIWAIPTRETRNRQAFVFQSPIVLRRSVRDNLIYPQSLLGIAKAEARSQAEASVKAIGLEKALDLPAGNLSGGEKQKLALARALIRTPELLLLDEPCSNLDGRATRSIETMLLRAHAQGTRIIMATHDLGQAKRLASDVIFLLHGKVHEAAPAREFFKATKTSEARAFLNGDIVD
jgi:tungstate transport system ATP-binding protein